MTIIDIPTLHMIFQIFPSIFLTQHMIQFDLFMSVLNHIWPGLTFRDFGLVLMSAVVALLGVSVLCVCVCLCLYLRAAERRMGLFLISVGRPALLKQS